MLTGKDEKSLIIMKDIIDKKATLKELAEWHGASLNQVNKLSRLVSIHNKCSSLDEELLTKLKELGLKALVLGPISDNIEAMTDILNIIDVNIKRDELSKMPFAYKESQEAFKEAKAKADKMISALNDKEEEFKQKICRLEMLKKQLDERITDFDDMSPDGKQFALEHLGIYKDKYILKRRVDIAWQQYLKSKKVIKFNSTEYVYYVEDMEQLKKQIENRIKADKYMYFDYTRKKEWECYMLQNVEYKHGSKLQASILPNIEKYEQQIAIINREKTNIKKEIDKLKKEYSASYMQQAEISNQLSSQDLIKHTRLQNESIKYLYKRGYASVVEVSIDNYRFDAIGFDLEQNIVIVEAKASINDLKQDKKFENYKKYCNKLYLIVESSLFNKHINYISERVSESGSGLLVVSRDGECLSYIEAEEHAIDDNIRKELVHKIGRKLSSKFINGFN